MTSVSDDEIYYRADAPLWWPRYDHKPDKCLHRVQAHIGAVDATIRLCTQNWLCIQAGGHAGLWPKRLAGHFMKVLTFEPEPVLFECMRRNLLGVEGITIRPEALGAFCGEVKLMPHKSAGGWAVLPDGTLPVQQVTIDSLNVQECDAIVLDIEGYEAEALEGARKTIDRFRPVLHLEVLPRSREAIEAKIAEFGYVKKHRIHADEIFVHAG